MSSIANGSWVVVLLLFRVPACSSSHLMQSSTSMSSWVVVVVTRAPLLSRGDGGAEETVMGGGDEGRTGDVAGDGEADNRVAIHVSFLFANGRGGLFCCTDWLSGVVATASGRAAVVVAALADVGGVQTGDTGSYFIGFIAAPRPVFACCLCEVPCLCLRWRLAGFVGGCALVLVVASCVNLSGAAVANPLLVEVDEAATPVRLLRADGLDVSLLISAAVTLRDACVRVSCSLHCWISRLAVAILRLALSMRICNDEAELVCLTQLLCRVAIWSNRVADLVESAGLLPLLFVFRTEPRAKRRRGW